MSAEHEAVEHLPVWLQAAASLGVFCAIAVGGAFSYIKKWTEGGSEPRVAAAGGSSAVAPMDGAVLALNRLATAGESVLKLFADYLSDLKIDREVEKRLKDRLHPPKE